MNDLVLDVQGLRKSYEQGETSVEVLKNVDLQVLTGQKHAIIGASGAGKSTLFKMIKGELKPKSGDVHISNGARCFARFILKTVGAAERLSFETIAGVISARFAGDRVTVNLTPPKDLRLGVEISLSTGVTPVYTLNTGVPHAVLFVPDADQAMVREMGREIRFHEHFAPAGTNVNFVQILEPGHIRVRTYERGVEGETLACGTGVSAAAMIASRVHGFDSPVKVQVEGQETLNVSFGQENGAFAEVCLEGPADFVFEGKIEL